MGICVPITVQDKTSTNIEAGTIKSKFAHKRIQKHPQTKQQDSTLNLETPLYKPYKENTSPLQFTSL